MSDFWKWLEGKKTNIGLVLTSIITLIRTQQLVPESWNPWLEVALVLIGMLTGIAYKAGQRRTELAQAKSVEVQQDAAADVKAAADQVTAAANEITAKPNPQPQGLQQTRYPERSGEQVSESTQFHQPPPPRFGGGR